MTSERRGKFRGRTISEWISLVPGELSRDAVNLTQILSAGQIEFELSESELVDYIRRNIIALLDAGAIPVGGGKGTGYEWVAKYHYGTTKDEIASAIVAEWHANKEDEMYSWGLWFARPRPGRPYVKL
jgi:hypothetical protein